MKILFLLYPTSRVKVDEDSSFWIMRELVQRRHTVGYFESKDLLWKNDALRALAAGQGARIQGLFAIPSLPDTRASRGLRLYFYSKGTAF